MSFLLFLQVVFGLKGSKTHIFVWILLRLIFLSVFRSLRVDREMGGWIIWVIVTALVLRICWKAKQGHLLRVSFIRIQQRNLSDPRCQRRFLVVGSEDEPHYSALYSFPIRSLLMAASLSVIYEYWPMICPENDARQIVCEAWDHDLQVESEVLYVW